MKKKNMKNKIKLYNLKYFKIIIYRIFKKIIN